MAARPSLSLGVALPELETITDYHGLIEALRARKDALGLSNEIVDELGGLTRGHTDKILGPSRNKNLSPMTFDVMLGVLALQVSLVPDIDAALKMESRWEKRSPAHVRAKCSLVSKKVLDSARPHILSEMSAKGVEARKTKLTPIQRSKIARKAAKARWRLAAITNN